MQHSRVVALYLTYERKERLEVALLYEGADQGEHSGQEHGRDEEGFPTAVVHGKHAEQVRRDL